MLGNRATQQLLQSNADGPEAGAAATAQLSFARGFHRAKQPASPAPIQAKLTAGPDGDAYEREAESVADQVMRLPQARPGHGCSCKAGCLECSGKQAGQAAPSLQMKRGATAEGREAAPPIVHEVLGHRGRPLDGAARALMEARFGQSFAHVRVHTDAAAAASAQALGALAYTARNHVVFGTGQYAPGTLPGKHLLAHELSHVVQQRALTSEPSDGSWVVQRVCDVSKRPTGNAIASQVKGDYEKAVRDGTYCRDTGATGVFHSGECYREVPSKLGLPGGDQVCFDRKTGECTEDSPDKVSAVWGKNTDGSCKLGFARSLGHFAEDIFPSEPVLVGSGFGLLTGTAIGLASNLGPYRLLGVASGLLLGTTLGAALGTGLRPLGRRLGRRGYVPSLELSTGLANPVPNLTAGATWQARLYIGAAKRERPLLGVFYPEFGLGVTLIGETAGGASETKDIGPSAITSLVAGIRVDPGEAGGHHLSFFGGPALVVHGGAAVGAEAGVALGRRWRWVGYSAKVGIVHDSSREPGARDQLTLGMGVELGPEKPDPPEKNRVMPQGGALSRKVVVGIQGALDAGVSTEALLPPQLRGRLARARKAADHAGPDEEASSIKARNAAEADAAGFIDAHDVAFDLAVLMDKARRQRSPFVKLEFTQYGAAGVSGGGTREAICKEIRRIALILRDHLPEGAAGVNTIVVVFRHEQAAVRQEIRLPGWAPRVKGPFD